MGSPDDELDRFSDEGPQHEVTIAPFFMGMYPVTQAQWRAVSTLPEINQTLKPEPSHFKGDNLPVEQVSWLEATEFCDRLSIHTDRKIGLPSEAQWEYACRAGTTTPFHFGETIDSTIANYCAIDRKIGENQYSGKYGDGKLGKYLEKTTPVGFFRNANQFGLFDMHGNVWEWCADHWHESYKDALTDGSTWLDQNSPEDAKRLLRGGSWGLNPGYCRSAVRSRSSPVNRLSSFGFRVSFSVARTLP